MGEELNNNTPQPEQKKGGNVVDKTAQTVQKGKKMVDNVKKAKKIANAAKTLSMSGPLMYVLFWVFVVIVAIIIITGIVMFLVTMPGMVMEKLKALFKEVGNYVAAFFGADTTAQIDEVQVYETLDYLEDMGWDIKAEGFLTGYYDMNDEAEIEKNLSDSEKEAGYDIDEEIGVVRSADGGNVIFADSDFIFTYIMSDNYVYTLKNDNLATQKDTKNWFEAITTAIATSWYKIENFLYGPILDAIGVTDGMMEKYGKGLIGLYYDSSVGVEKEAVNQGSFWNWDAIKIDPESKKLSIKRRSFMNNNNALEFSLDGWTGRYGMPLEFLLSVHKATMMPDLAFDMATSFPTEIHLYLHDTSGEAISGYKTSDGNYIKWSAIQEAIAGFEGRNWLTSWFADVSAWLTGYGAKVEAAKQCGVEVGNGEGSCSCTFKDGVGDDQGFQLEKKGHLLSSATWHYTADYSYTNEEGEEVVIHEKGQEYKGERTTIKIVDSACEYCKGIVDGIWQYMGDNTDYNFQAYTPYISKVTDHWYRDVYFVLPSSSNKTFVDYDYEYEAVMKERWTLYETYTADEADKGTYKYNPNKAGEFIAFRINEKGEYMKDSNNNYVIYDGTFDEARGETLYEKNSKGEYVMYTGVIDEKTTTTLYRYMGDGVYEEYDPNTVIAVAKKAVTISAADKDALKDQGWIENSSSIWSAYKVEDTTSGFEKLFNEEDIANESNEYYKIVMENCYINLNLEENLVQVGEGQRTETNTHIKKMFLQNKYFRYDGSQETAEIITALREQDPDKDDDNIGYGFLDENELKKTVTIDGETYKASDYSGVVTLNQDSLNAFSMLENTHTLDADYIYRDFKELIVELGYFEKEELTDETPRLLQFLVPDIGSAEYPNRTIDKRENEFGTMIHSKHDIDANKKYTLQELINQMGSEIPDDINKEQAEKANEATIKGLRLGNQINNVEIGAIGDPSDGSISVSQVTIDEFLETTREMCEYINKEGYDYCVLVGDEGDGKQKCHHAPVHGNPCSLPTTFGESQESVSKHNFCCATLVSWALQNVGVMPDSAHLDGANSLAQWIADNLNPEQISIGEPLKPGDILCYEGHVDLVGEEHNGGFVKYNGGHYTEAGSVEFEGSSCIQHIDGWPSDDRLKFALRLPWGQSEAGVYEGFIGNEAVVSPVTGILLEYGTYDEKSIDSVSGDEYRVNVDLKYGPSLNLGNTENAEEQVKGETPKEETPVAENTTTPKEDEVVNAERRKFSDKVGYAKILVLNKEVFETIDTKVTHKWKDNNDKQGLLSSTGAFSELVTTEKQYKELTDDSTKDYLSETVYAYKEYAEMYEKYGIAGQVIYIDGFKCELPDENFKDTDGDQDLSDETGNPQGKALKFDDFKIKTDDIKAQKENELIVTKYEMPAEYKLASKKATEKLNIEEKIKNEGYSAMVVDNLKTYKPLENLEKLVVIKEGTVLGRTYTNKEIVDARLANGDDQKYNYEYYAPAKNVTDDGERCEDKLLGNYIRIIMRNLEDTVVENVEDYMKLDEVTKTDCKFEHLAYFLGCLEEGFYESMDLGSAYGFEVLKDGAGNTTAFGLTKAVAGIKAVKSAYPNFAAHLEAGSVPKDEAQDVLILTLEAAKEEIQNKLNVPLDESDSSLFALIDLHHASPSECYDVIDYYNSKSNNLTKEEMMAVFTENWGSNENYGVQLRRRGRNRGWIASEGRWFLYQDGSEGDEVIFDSDEPWTEFCNGGGTYEMTRESSGLYHVEKGADPDYINK